MEKTEFGAFVAENRRKLGLTQKALADRLHVTDKAVSKWERGLSYPDVTLLEPLAAVFGMDVSALVSARPRETPPEGETGVRELLDISGEGLRAERKRGRRRTFLLAALAVLAAWLVWRCRRLRLDLAKVRAQAHALQRDRAIRQNLQHLLERREAEIHRLRWVWVKGHADNELNARCDALAVAESRKYL